MDNGSTDDSVPICEEFRLNHPELRILLRRDDTPGPSAARNTGSDIAKGDWLIFTDADCVPSPNWISDYMVHFPEAGLGAVAGCIRPYPPFGLIQKAISLFTLPPITKETIHSASNLREGLYPTANLAVKREIFELVGGFNNCLRYGEDHELCYKIYNAGYTIKAIENANVEHIHRSTFRGFLRQAFGFGSSHPFELRYFTSGRTIVAAPLVDINRPTPGKWIWLDFNQADKKLLLSLVPGLFWPPLFFFSVLYFFYLCLFVHRVGRERSLFPKVRELPILALLLIMKSFALSAGRIVYSFKHNVICV